MAKKIIGLVLALTLIFSVGTCALSASAFFPIAKPDAGISFDLGKIKDLLNPGNWIGSKGDKDTTDKVTDTVDKVTDTVKDNEKEPLLNFYFDYDVIATIKWGIHIGHAPTTTEVVTEPVVEEEPSTEAPTEEVIVPVTDETPLGTAPVEITDKAPLADAEQVANTGDAGIATIVALTVVSGAALVVAKKK